MKNLLSKLIGNTQPTYFSDMKQSDKLKCVMESVNKNVQGKEINLKREMKKY